MANIVIVGPGGWGTALAVMAHRNGHQVTMWGPFEQELESIRRYGEHRKLLPGIPVAPDITLTTDLQVAAEADLVLLTVPSFAIQQTAEKLRPILPKGALLVNAAKGIDQQTHKRFSQILSEMLPQARVTVLSGPSHAEEVARGIPTTVVAASTDMQAAEEVQDALMNPEFRIYVNDDVIGVELGGALKNVIALAAGICDGLGMGDNTKAALMTRGLSEIARLGVVMGAKPETFAGLSGMGDLMVTCSSMHSRNRRAGIAIGKGIPPEEAIRQTGTVEGYLAAKTAWELSQKYGVDMPITEQCYRVCYQGKSPRESLMELMARPKRHEIEKNTWLLNNYSTST